MRKLLMSSVTIACLAWGGFACTASALAEALDGSKYLITQGTVTDYRLDLQAVTAAMAAFETQMTAR